MTNSGEAIRHKLLTNESLLQTEAQFQDGRRASASRTAASRMGTRHLSKIQEETDSREHSFCCRPSVVQQQTGAAGKPGVSQRQEVTLHSTSSSLPLNDQNQRLQNNRSLTEELTHIEAELQESVRLDEERRQEAEFLRGQENKLLWQNLCYLSLSQRVARPWVSSYFKVFPMHIYCLPVQSTAHRGRRHGSKTRS